MPIEKEEEIHERTHRQHAIPQHIGAFKFRLVGQFTLKEFGYLAGFGILAWLILASKLFPPIKLPIAAALASLGVAFAFIPVAGRPLDKMLLNFFRSITIPTQRIWIKKGALPEFLKPDFGKPKLVAVTGKTPTSRKVLEEYLAQFGVKPAQADLAELAFLSKLDFSLDGEPAVTIQTPTPSQTTQPVKVQPMTLTPQPRLPSPKTAAILAAKGTAQASEPSLRREPLSGGRQEAKTVKTKDVEPERQGVAEKFVTPQQVSQIVLSEVEKAVAKKIPKEAPKEFLEKLSEQVAKNLASQVAKEVLQQTLKVPEKVFERATQTSRQVARQVAKEVASQVVQQIVKSTVKTPKKTVEEKPAEIAKAVAAQVTAKTRNIARQVAKDVAKEVARKAASEIAAEVLKKVSKTAEKTKEVLPNKVPKEPEKQTGVVEFSLQTPPVKPTPEPVPTLPSVTAPLTLALSSTQVLPKLPVAIEKTPTEINKPKQMIEQHAISKIEEVETLAGITVEERKPKKEPSVVPLAAAASFVERPVITVPTPGAGPTIMPAVGEIKVRKLRSQPDLFGEFSLKVLGEKKFEISEELKKRLGLTLIPSQLSEDKDLTVSQKPAAAVATTPQSLTAEEKTSHRFEVESKKVLDQTKPQKERGWKIAIEETVRPKTVQPSPVPTPAEPNLIAGFVKDATGHLLEDVILIVKNENEAPVRALKTNLLGQFSISTPLPNGKYIIEAEKEGHKFSIIDFEARGEIVSPIEIVAKS